jgi:RecA/RadA recombinase
MVKPYDFSKFRKSISKSLNIETGFFDPTHWVDTGNYAVNMMISGDFKRGIPLGKVTVLAGESGSGKSFIAVGKVIEDCQKQGILAILLDSENGVDKGWAERFNIDIDKMLRIPVSTVDECAKIVTEYIADYDLQYANVDKADRQPVMFIIDSLGMLSTPTELDQFADGNMKGDMGRKAKQLKAFVTQCLKLFGSRNIGLVATNHTYKSQDQFNPDDVVSGGSGFIFASSIILTMNKLKLKEDEDGQKIKEVRGIRSKIKCVKSRFSKPFEEVEVQIPYNGGMNPYSGLFDFFLGKNVIQKDGTRYKFTINGEELKMFRKQIEPSHYDALMDSFSEPSGDIGFGDELEDLADESGDE